jgi:hypothetical protein
MYAGIAREDRKLLAAGGGLLVLMLTASILLAPPNRQFSSPVPSTYSPQPAGAEAAYLLLERLHYSVRRWEDAPAELPTEANAVLLILAEPTEAPTDKERKALEDWVRGGGHVLYTGAGIQSFFPEADISDVPPDPAWRSFSPSVPSYLDRGAARITIQPQANWQELRASQVALYGDGDFTAVVSWRVGKGDVLWWAGSTPLTNAGITRENNLTFFLNCVSAPSNGESPSIYWDEYFHGQRSSLWSYARNTPLRWGAAQLGFLAVALIFTFSRRSGPVYIPPRISRLSPLEFVDTLGGLYERAGAASSAVAVSELRLRFLLTRQLGLAADAPSASLSQAAEDRLGWKDFVSSNLLGRAEKASRSRKLRPREALALVQDLERHADKLEIRPRSTPEKT